MFAPQPIGTPSIMHEEDIDDNVYILAYSAEIEAYCENVLLAIPVPALAPMSPPPPPAFSCGKCDKFIYHATQKGLSKHLERCHSAEVSQSTPSFVVDKKQRSCCCSHCSYSSNNRVRLLEHKKQEHPDFYPHVCPTCSFASDKKCHLTRHIRERHDLCKPFQCHYCTYASARSDALRKHEERNHFDELLFQLV